MRWQEILETLKTYDDENRKGWYSYTWANHNVWIGRKNEPNKMYCMELYRYGFQSTKVHLEELKEDDGKLYWDYTNTYIPYSELPDDNNWIVVDAIFHPYIGMVKIIKLKDDNVDPNTLIHCTDLTYRRASEVNEKRINFRVLNGIRQFIGIQDELMYKKRWWISEEDKARIEVDDCAYCGMGENEYSLAEFHLNFNEYHICTSGNINKENKHRRHFKEQEYLFPWKSNGWNPDECLYIQTSSLSIEADKEALKKRKDKIVADIKMLLDKAGVEEYELVEIRKPFKYFNL